MVSKPTSRIVSIVILIVVGCAGYFIGKGPVGDTFSFSEIHENQSESLFTNPLLDCDVGSESIFKSQIAPSKSSIDNAISKEREAGNISHASVYYRDLNNGPWLSINAEEKFFPASLMKVSLMMYFYNKSETVPGLLDQVVDLSKINLPVSTADQYFKPEVKVEKNKKYTIRQLIQIAIKYSDNEAAEYLVSLMGPNGFENLLKDLFIDFPQNGQDDYITVRQYATFFRVLFNSSYLDRTNSEEVLGLLSKTTFNKALTKYLPPTLRVSHKFGEKLSDDQAQNQIHDCGIVYMPNHPYLLCVMTRGSNKDKMAESIALISKVVYEDMQGKILRAQ